jgi:serine/threonine-protein kinase
LSDGFNQRIGGYYWADESRQLIKVIKALTGFNAIIKSESCNSLTTSPPEFLDELTGYMDFLQQYNGSKIPDSTQRLNVFALRKSQIFKLDKSLSTKQFDDSKKRDLQLIGVGSYATVFKFHNRDTGEWLALKRANEDLSEEEKERFAGEFDFLNKIQSQFVISVYLYEEVVPQYTMEYMPYTLKDFMEHNNNRLDFQTRKNMVAQFLRGLQDIHEQDNALHRDLSPTNILVKPQVNGAISVKISDFGLIKIPDSTLTKTRTSKKGVYAALDPLLSSYREYSRENEIFSAGQIINYLFTGKQRLVTNTQIGEVVTRATSSKSEDRYPSAKVLWEAVKVCGEA